jgi:protein-L-isoaspartate O-methyltransferase
MTAPCRRPPFVALLLLGLSAICCGSPSRAASDEAERLARALALRAGMTVADIGAGEGDFSEELARRVGDSGRVFSTEIEPEEVEQLRRRFEDAGLDNVTVVLGQQSDAGLPDACCEAMLLRLVYHHFTRPDEMRASLRRALRSGGLVAVIEIEPQPGWAELPGVPERGGHGIRPKDLVREMRSDGFEVVERHDGWDGREGRYCVIFRR